MERRIGTKPVMRPVFGSDSLFNNLKLWLPVNEMAGAGLNDYTPKHNNALLSGGISWNGHGVTLDGTDGIGTLNRIPNLTNWTLMSKVTPTTVSGTKAWFDQGDILVYQVNDGIAYGFASSGNVEKVDLATSLLTAGKTYDIAVTKQGSVLRLYLDGVPTDTFTNSTAVYTSESNMIIGRRASLVYADLNGTSHYFSRSDADFPESGITGANDLTIQAWIKLDDVSGQKAIVSKYTAAGNKRMYTWRINGDELTFATDDTGAGGFNERNSTNANLVAGEWVHVAVSYDASAGTCTFYKDGSPLTDNGAALDTSIADEDPPFEIGVRDGGFFFNGGIFNVALFDDIRTPTEILASATTREEDLSGAGNIIGQWMFDDAAAVTQIDNTQGDAGRDLNLVGGSTATYGVHTRTQDIADFAFGNVTIHDRALARDEIERWRAEHSKN